MADLKIDPVVVLKRRVVVGRGGGGGVLGAPPHSMKSTQGTQRKREGGEDCERRERSACGRSYGRTGLLKVGP